jgi:hypothetical protein
MPSACLIGYGKWGKILFKKLHKILDIKKILNSKNYSLKNLEKVDWVVIATPNKTHYKIIKACIKIKKNIFCEKPLTLKLTEAVELYKLAKLNKVKLIVSDLSQYKKKIPINRKINTFQRFKNSNDFVNNKIKRYDLLYNLAYHDIGYIYDFIKGKKINSIKIITTAPYLKFSIKLGKKEFLFHYDTNKKNKIYKFNKISLYQKRDIVEKMLVDYLIRKKPIITNIKKSLFIIKILEKIRNEMK